MLAIRDPLRCLLRRDAVEHAVRKVIRHLILLPQHMPELNDDTTIVQGDDLFLERPEEIRIDDRFLLGVPKAVELPVADPGGHAIDKVLRVRLDDDVFEACFGAVIFVGESLVFAGRVVEVFDVTCELEGEEAGRQFRALVCMDWST